MFFPHNTAVGATRFRQDRIEAGLPVASKDQVKRAKRLIDGNPMLRGHHSPLGIELLALKLPLTRKERIANRKSVEDGGLGLKLEPVRIRTGDETELMANPEAVEAFVDQNPGLSEREAAEAVAAALGFSGDINQVIKRTERWTRSSNTGKRVCGHLRDKLRLISAISQVVTLIRERAAAATPVAA